MTPLHTFITWWPPIVALLNLVMLAVLAARSTRRRQGRGWVLTMVSSGLQWTAKKQGVVGGTTWYASLVDSFVEDGGLYNIDDPASPSYIGTNNDEACLIFEHGGVKRYYGGGAGVYVSAAEVLLAFHSLCWFSITFVNNVRMVRVEQVVRRWRDRQGNILP